MSEFIESLKRDAKHRAAADAARNAFHIRNNKNWSMIYNSAEDYETLRKNLIDTHYDSYPTAHGSMLLNNRGKNDTVKIADVLYGSLLEMIDGDLYVNSNKLENEEGDDKTIYIPSRLHLLDDAGEIQWEKTDLPWEIITLKENEDD